MIDGFFSDTVVAIVSDDGGSAPAAISGPLAERASDTGRLSGSVKKASSENCHCLPRHDLAYKMFGHLSNEMENLVIFS